MVGFPLLCQITGVYIPDRIQTPNPKIRRIDGRFTSLGPTIGFLEGKSRNLRASLDPQGVYIYIYIHIYISIYVYVFYYAYISCFGTFGIPVIPYTVHLSERSGPAARHLGRLGCTKILPLIKSMICLLNPTVGGDSHVIHNLKSWLKPGSRTDF